jgi:hypothetical protein
VARKAKERLSASDGQGKAPGQRRFAHLRLRHHRGDPGHWQPILHEKLDGFLRFGQEIGEGGEDKAS